MALFLDHDGVARTHGRDEYTAEIYHETKEQMEDTIRYLKSCQGWIPVTERLPKERLRPEHKNTASDLVIATAETYGGDHATILAKTVDGEWWVCCEAREAKKIIAWMPLPEPYRGDCDEK